MSSRRIRLSENNTVTRCPKCGQNRVFTLHAVQFSEDCCETFVVCVCGFEATSGSKGDRYENVWGELDEPAARVALSCWNDALAAQSGARAHA